MRALVQLPQAFMGLTHKQAQLAGILLIWSGGELFANLPELGDTSRFCKISIEMRGFLNQ